MTSLWLFTKPRPSARPGAEWQDCVFTVHLPDGRTFGINAVIHRDLFEAWNNQPLPVTLEGTLEYSVPHWIVSLGLLKPWCRLLDVLMFRNPFRLRSGI